LIGNFEEFCDEYNAGQISMQSENPLKTGKITLFYYYYEEFKLQAAKKPPAPKIL
jgi:hypothetical protein